MATALYRKSGDTTFKRVTGEPPITVSGLTVAGDYEASKGDGTLVTATVAIQQPTQMDPPLTWGIVEEASITLRAADDETDVTGYEFEVDLTSGDYSSPPYSGTQSVANFGDPIDLPTVTPGTYKVRSRATNSSGAYLWSEDAIMEVYATANTTTVPKDGIEFIFGGVHTHGQDAAGYPWLLNETGGEVALIDTNPRFAVVNGTFGSGASYSNREIHGLMLNPIYTVPDDLTSGEARFGQFQGWDSFPTDGIIQKPAYTDSINLDPAKQRQPLRLTEGTLQKALGHLTPLADEGREAIKTMAAVTVVTRQPAANAIMGMPQTTDDAEIYTTADIDLTRLPRRAAPPGQTLPDIDAEVEFFAQCSQYLISDGNVGRLVEPTDAASAYGGQNGRGYQRGLALAALTQDFSDPKLLDLATQVCHEAICLMRRRMTGGVWEPNGGLNNGRWTVLTAGSALLNDATMQSMVSSGGSYGAYSNRRVWHELGQAFEITDQMTYEIEGGDFSFLDSPFQDFPGTSGFQVGDILTFTGGVTWNGTPGTLRVVEVGASGELDDDSVVEQYKAYYYTRATGLTGGSGTGLSYNNEFGRKNRSVLFGMQGEVEYAGNYYATSSTDPINAHMRDSYRYNTRKANAIGVTAISNITGVLTIVGGTEVFEYAERAFYFDDSTRDALQQLTAYEIAYIEAYGGSNYGGYRASGTGYADPGTAPVPVSFGCNRNLAWIKFDQLLLEDYRPGPQVPGDFTVNIAGSPVTVVEALSKGRTIILTLDTFAAEGEAVTIAAAQSSSPDVIQSVFNREAAAITATAATNETVDFVDPVPNSVVNDSNFFDPANRWDVPISSFDLIPGEGFNKEFNDNDNLKSIEFPVTAGQNYEYSFFCRNAASVTGMRLTYWFYDVNGNELQAIDNRIGGSTFDPVEGVNTKGSRVAPAGSVTGEVELSSVFGNDYIVKWLSVEPVA